MVRRNFGKRYFLSHSAVIAANLYLIGQSKSKKTNLYTIDKNIVYIDLSIDNNGANFLIIDEDMLKLVTGILWRERYNKVYCTETNKRIYIEEKLFPGKKILQYLDKNPFNNKRDNLIF